MLVAAPSLNLSGIVTIYDLLPAVPSNIKNHAMLAENSAQNLKKFLLPDTAPSVHPSAFIAPGAIVLGAVEIGSESSVWYSSVLRGDINRIVLGHQTNVQDGCVLHVSDDFACVLGDRVTVGHRAVIHACTVGDEVLVGMGAIILDGAQIGPRCIIAAGALVTKGAVIPEGSLVVGAPAKVVRSLTPEEMAKVREHVIVGARLFDDVVTDFDRHARDVALYHHARWDGSGYPTVADLRQLQKDAPHAAGPMIDPRGENIPLFARIVALADVYDALVTPRAYKKAWSVAEALEAIRAEAGRQFDPELAELMPDVIHRRAARIRTEAA